MVTWGIVLNKDALHTQRLFAERNDGRHVEKNETNTRV